MHTEALFPGLQQSRREADRLSQSSAEVKNARHYTSPSPVRLHGVVLVKHRDNFTLLYMVHY